MSAAIDYLMSIADGFMAYDGPEDFADFSRVKVVRDSEIEDSRRWSYTSSIVFEVTDENGKLLGYVEVTYDTPATEMQESEGPGSWSYRDVVPKLVQVVDWVKPNA